MAEHFADLVQRSALPKQVRGRVWRLFRGRNRRHYAGFRTIPGELVFGPVGGSLAKIFPA